MKSCPSPVMVTNGKREWVARFDGSRARQDDEESCEMGCFAVTLRPVVDVPGGPCRCQLAGLPGK